MRLERCKQCVFCVFFALAILRVCSSFPRLQFSNPVRVPTLQIAVAEIQVTNMLLRRKILNHNGTEPRPQAEFTENA